MSAHDGLNHAQFTQLADELNYDPQGYGSGFTVKAYGPDAMSRAKDSYLVADRDHEQRTPNPVSAGDLSTYAEANEGPLRGGEGVHMGAWNPSRKAGDTDTRGYLDVSHAMPRSEAGYHQAVKLGLENRQQAFGEVDEEGEYVKDHSLADIQRSITDSIRY